MLKKKKDIASARLRKNFHDKVKDLDNSNLIDMSSSNGETNSTVEGAKKKDPNSDKRKNFSEKKSSPSSPHKTHNTNLKNANIGNQQEGKQEIKNNVSTLLK